MKIARWLLLTWFSFAAPCAAQFVRPPVIVRPPPVRVPVHVPVHVPHAPHTQVHQQGGRADRDDHSFWYVVAGIVGVGGLGWGGYKLVSRAARSAVRRAVIRIVATPPGEAPEEIRRAWIGLVLPLIPRQVHSEALDGREAVSHEPVFSPAAYAVEGKTAIDILASANPDAAEWWKHHAPEVVGEGYQLVFPAEVCERLDDLGG